MAATTREHPEMPVVDVPRAWDGQNLLPWLELADKLEASTGGDFEDLRTMVAERVAERNAMKEREYEIAKAWAAEEDEGLMERGRYLMQKERQDSLLRKLSLAALRLHSSDLVEDAQGSALLSAAVQAMKLIRNN
jgi:hypothetical protein